MQFFTEQNKKKLIDASIEGNITLVKELVESGTNPNAIDEYGDTALSQAALKGHREIVTFLLTKMITSSSKNHALIFACQAGHEEIVDELLKKGADVNVSIKGYQTPLFQAIVKNKEGVFKRLLQETSIKIDVENNGIIPLHLAAFNGRLEMVKQLIEKGADLFKSNKKGWTAIQMAEQKEHKEVINYLEEKEKELQEYYSNLDLDELKK